MAIYVLGDLHLSFGVDKPMDIFGWGNHSEKIKENWKKTVKNEDTVILPGDFSWAMSLEEAYQDFAFLHSLPGIKILSKGNHDYWWSTMAKMDKYLQENQFEKIYFLQNNSYLVENKIMVGTRGWTTANWTTENGYKMLKRENERLKLSIQSGTQNFGTDKELICFLHYPPFFREENVPEEIDLIKTMQENHVTRCYYGHLHGESHQEAFEGEKQGIEFRLVSSDYLGFSLKKL